MPAVSTHFMLLQTSKQMTLNHSITPQKKKYLTAPDDEGGKREHSHERERIKTYLAIYKVQNLTL